MTGARKRKAWPGYPLATPEAQKHLVPQSEAYPQPMGSEIIYRVFVFNTLLHDMVLLCFLVTYKRLQPYGYNTFFYCVTKKAV